MCNTSGVGLAAPHTEADGVRGFVLVLVVANDQADSETDALARVYREFDCLTIHELARDVVKAAEQAGNQIVRRSREVAAR